MRKMWRVEDRIASLTISENNSPYTNMKTVSENNSYDSAQLVNSHSRVTPCYVHPNVSQENFEDLISLCESKECHKHWKKRQEETEYLKLVIKSLELPASTKDIEFIVFESESYVIEAKKDEIESKLLTPFNLTSGNNEDMKLPFQMLQDYAGADDLSNHIPEILQELVKKNVCAWDLMFVGRGYYPRLHAVDICNYKFEWTN